MKESDECKLRHIVELLRECGVEASPAEPSSAKLGAMWISSCDASDGRVLYVDGSEYRAVQFDLKLRYRDVSPCDELEAFGMLERSARHATESGELYELESPRKVTSSGSSAVYSVRMEYREVNPRSLLSAVVRFYIGGLENGVWYELGVGFKELSLNVHPEMHKRRYIEEDRCRISVLGIEECEIRFKADFNVDAGIIGLMLNGECSILAVRYDGICISERYTVTDMSMDGDISGVLSGTGYPEYGHFYSESGTFVPLSREDI